MTTQIGIEPYGYQLNAVDALERAFISSRVNALMVAASGIGKGIISGLFLQKHLGEGRWLCLCHDNEILTRLAAEHRKVLGSDVPMGFFHGGEKEYAEVNILYASFQTMRDWRFAFFEDEFVGLLVDESHHGEARTFRETIEYFQTRYRLGMTATPERMDGKDIRRIFGPEVVNLPLELAIAQGWLTPVEYHVISDDINTVRLKRMLDDVLGGKHVSVKQLNETIFVRKRDEEIAKIALDSSEQTVIFCEGIRHIEHFRQFLPECGVYHSKQRDDQNKRVLETFDKGDLQFILAVNKFNEGIHVPQASRIVFLRCTDSTTIFLQQLGRGLSRGDEDKTKVTVLDFVTNADRLLMIRDVVGRIRRLAYDIPDRELLRDVLHVSGEGFDFIFSDEQLDVFDIIDRTKHRYISEVPLLLAEYSPKNPLQPDQVTAGTMQRLWWKCSTCGYEWMATGSGRIGRRNRRGTNCPACANKVATPTNNLAATHPELAAEYMPPPKNALPAEEVVAGSHQKFWWKCPSCDHEWQALGSSRAIGTGCPGCAGKVVTSKNNLATVRPDLLEEYSPKNPLPGSQVLATTEIRLWWKCSTCGYEWMATSYSRVSRGSGCSACLNKVATPTNNLAVTHPELAAEYMPPPKNALPAEEVVAGTNVKLWWKCSQCEHEWQARGNDRLQGKGCGACANYVVTAHNNLAATHPELAAEYMPPPKNALPAEEVVAGVRRKFWWKCSTCGYEWESPGYQRVVGIGCPSCSRRIVTSLNNLAATHPELAAEYMPPPKNALPAEEVVAGTSKKLWWKCPQCGHEWQVSGHSRVSKKTGCPACTNQVVTSTNNLAATHPELAAEYMPPPKNALPAEEVVAGTSKKLWWKCPQCGHEWQKSASARVRGSGCPACANRVATPTNNLAATHPELAAEYMPPPKNVLPADQVIAGTSKKLWWKCPTCGHEWQAQGNSRVQGTGCPKHRYEKLWETRRRKKDAMY